MREPAGPVPNPRVYIVGTCDTKFEELCYVRDLLRAAGLATCLVDVGIRSRERGVDVTPAQVAACGPGGKSILALDDRGRAVSAMAQALSVYLLGRIDVAGVIGLGGSGNTTIVTAAMQTLPIGVPKVMVSTQASGNTAPYVGSSDICMMYAITDVAGLNRISRVVLANAAHALAGMVVNHAPAVADPKPAIGLTMFGVTTPCITGIRQALDAEFDCIVFHATGTGGRSMEKLAESGLFSGLIDITTTEIADLLCGGVCSAGEDRLGAVARTRLPYVGSVGAMDMVNFGAPDTVPARYRERTFYRHNPHATLMRTTPEECAAIGRWIGERLNRCEGPVRFLLPEGGLSAIDAPGQPFHDPAADAALFAAIEATVIATADRQVMRSPHHINDPGFAAEAAALFRAICTNCTIVTPASTNQLRSLHHG
ncbi:MAG: Tm-1-like ATP-binding domain-containing protein [Planctomycetes bacterium]|nr:Tm-1-like ATP-binding domain-containing protein [Planctomycetota bacterium]